MKIPSPRAPAQSLGELSPLLYKLGRSSTKPPFKIWLHNPKKDRFVSKQIEKSGVWDKQLVDPIVEYLQAHPNSTFLDVGANIGFFSLLAASAGAAKVISIEALPSNVVMLAASVASNSFEHIIHVYPYTVGAEEQKGMSVCILTESDNQGHSFVSTQAEDCTKVTMWTIDDILKNAGISKVDFMKIDIEGYEAHALRGMLSTLRLGPPCVLMFECNTAMLKDAGSSVGQFLNLLLDHGYQVSHSLQDKLKAGHINDAWVYHSSCSADL